MENDVIPTKWDDIIFTNEDLYDKLIEFVVQ